MCFDYFPLLVTHIQNIPWPREHRLLYNIAFAIDPMMEFQPQVTFQCALNYLWVTTLYLSLTGLSAAKVRTNNKLNSRNVVVPGIRHRAIMMGDIVNTDLSLWTLSVCLCSSVWPDKKWLQLERVFIRLCPNAIRVLPKVQINWLCSCCFPFH